MNLYESFYIRTTENSLIEAVVHIKPDNRPALIGRVLDIKQKPVKDAFVTIHLTGEENSLVGATYTDENGEFILAPLDISKLYVVRVSKNETDSRELIITSE